MAYDPNRREREQDFGGTRPYDDVLGGAVASSGVRGLPRPAAQALPGSTQGPTSTGHVNFDQIYNANADTATREAGKLQTAANQKGQAVQGGLTKLTGAKGAFSEAVRTGTVRGPTDAQKDWAKTGKTGVVQQIQPATTPGPIDPSKTGGSPDARTANAPPPKPMGGSPDARSANAERQAQPTAIDEEARKAVEAGAAGEYGGPGSLSDLDAYSKLVQDAVAAQDMAKSLASGNEGIQAQGMGALDAALLGAAGRRSFEDLGQRYGGLASSIDEANVASKGVADAARKQSQDAASAYQDLLDEFEGRVSADQDQLDAANKASAAHGQKLQEDHKKELSKAPYKWVHPEGLDSPEEFGQLYKDFGWDTDGEGRLINPEDAEMYGQLGVTNEIMAALATMTAAERRAWLDRRKKELGLE